MITAEILRANPQLEGLSEDQINAIITIGTNDTQSEINKAFGETYRKMDSTIESLTGIKRNGDEKTYDYMARAMQAQKDSLEPLQAEKARLEAELAKGGDDALKAQLDSVKAELANAKTAYADIQVKMKDAEKAHKAEIFGLTVGAEVRSAASGLKFKPEIPVSAANILIKSAVDKVMSMNPDYIDNGAGGKRLVFKGLDGAVLNNPNNSLNPYTAEELLQNELKDVLDSGRKQEGAGGPGSGAGDQPTSIDVSQAKTQVEAMEMITKALLARGITNGSPEFVEAKDKAWKDNNVNALPFR